VRLGGYGTVDLRLEYASAATGRCLAG